MAEGRIVILTGAGISKESGVDTFRAPGGIWSQYDLEDVATPQGFARNPQLVHQFYNARRKKLAGIIPNAAHYALARLEREWPGDVLVVTQNVDDLHERAGTTRLLHMHGELRKTRCQRCGDVVLSAGDLATSDICCACDAAGGMRPHVVWFGEMPFHMDRIYEALEACDLFISIGTSGNVYPASGLVMQVNAVGRAHTVELNLEPSEGATAFSEALYGKATAIVPDYVERLLARTNWSSTTCKS